MPRKVNALLPQPSFSEPVFSEGVPTADPTGFKVTPEDEQLYNGIEDLLKKDVVGFPASRGAPQDVLSLESTWGSHGSEVIKSIQAAGHIVFHAIGDSGASSAKSFPDEIKVADEVTNDFHSSDVGERPAFLYHLGDLVYNFGESEYYYDQFYDPFRDYPAPILAIPGNHDSFIVPNTPSGQEPLTIFTRNFCASKPVVTREAGSLHRTAMTQPGVYFTLDAPFVRIIGLFSNALEDPGVLSSENGKWKAVPDVQLKFLEAQLGRIKAENFAGALLLAVHHPPFSYATQTTRTKGSSGGKHQGNSVMLGQIDEICKAQHVYPHAFLSGHAHNYQRYTRSLAFDNKQISVPFVVCGDSGHNVNPLVRGTRNGQKASEPADEADVGYLDTSPIVQRKGLVLNKHDQRNYGYLRILVNAKQLIIEFHPVTQGSRNAGVDQVTVDLASHSVVKAARRGR